MRNAIGSYFVTLAAVAAAVVFYWIVGPLLANTLPLVTLFAAVTVAVCLGGYRLGLVAMIGGLLACVALLFWPGSASHPQLDHSLVDLAAYIFTSVIIIGFGEHLRRARLNLEQQKLRSGAALQRAEESERRFRLLADSAPVLIWVSGEDKLCTWFNRQWLEFVGRTMEHELGDGWTENIHAEDLDGCLRTCETAFDAREPFAMQYRMRRHDGEYRWILDKGIPLYGLAGEFNGYIGSAIDIDDHKRREEALRQADQRKDEFLATLSHELRNPLAPIRSAVEIFRRKELADDDLRRSREIIERQVARIARLLEDLLDLSRISHNKLVLRTEHFDIGAVMRDAIQTLRTLPDGARREIAVVATAGPLYLVADPVRVGQVFGNLLDNARKYSEPGTPIEVRMHALGTDVVVSVRDYGIGIEPGMLDEVFVMFSQSVPAMKRSQGGLGIGLALSKRIVELHGGSLKAQSAGAGKGSEFIVRLPLAASDGGRVP